MRKIFANEQGFTLFHLAAVLASFALASTAAIPYFIRKAEISAANRTARELSTVQEASKWYYLNNNGWPSSIQTLKNAGYLNPSWPGRNPWGNGYDIRSSATSFTVATTVPDGVGGILVRALPGVSSSINANSRTVSSSVPLPGYERKLTEVRNIAEEALSTAEGSAVPPHGPTYLFGTKINRKAICPPGYAVIRTMALGGRNNIGYVCQSVLREGTRLAALLQQISQMESTNQQLRSQNQRLEDSIWNLQDFFDENWLYRYWRRCVVDRDCDND